MPPANPALLVMDVQGGIVERFAGGEQLDRIEEAVDAARAGDVPVIFVRVAFRPGHPEISPRNRAFAAVRERGMIDDASTAIDPRVAPLDGEVVVTKRRVSAFTGSDLEVVLRGRGIDALVLCGFATSGVVLSTLRQAADMDFDLTVLHDACGDADDEVHRVLCEKVFPRQAAVLDVETWSASLPKPTV
jgi:nicotinamidase-related amidase